jgi:hypothetical protein
MPRTTLSAVQAELLNFTETLLVAADLLNDNIDNLGDLPELISAELEELNDVNMDSFAAASKDAFDNYISEILEMQAIVTLQIASSLTGNGSRGPYNRFAKSADFFSTSLQSPDRQFRHQFR